MPVEEHLHSTMVSINPLPALSTNAVIPIYIPLWYLLIETAEILSLIEEYIYIPLWYLLIRKAP